MAYEYDVYHAEALTFFNSWEDLIDQVLVCTVFNPPSRPAYPPRSSFSSLFLALSSPSFSSHPPLFLSLLPITFPSSLPPCLLYALRCSAPPSLLPSALPFFPPSRHPSFHPFLNRAAPPSLCPIPAHFDSPSL